MLSAIRKIKSGLVTRIGFWLCRHVPLIYNVVQEKMLPIERKHAQEAEVLKVTVGALFCVVFAGGTYKAINAVCIMLYSLKLTFIDAGVGMVIGRLLVSIHGPVLAQLDMGFVLNGIFNITNFVLANGIAGVQEVVWMAVNALYLDLLWFAIKEGLWEQFRALMAIIWSLIMMVQIMPWIEGEKFPTKTTLTWLVLIIPLVIKGFFSLLI